MITKECICGNNYQTTQNRLDDNRGKFCSKKCQYKNAHRPSGLKYEIVVQNKGWYKKGQPKTENWRKAMKESVPWNKGTRGMVKPNKSSFTRKRTAGRRNIGWRGDDVGYFGSHSWMIRNYGKADICENRECNILDIICYERSTTYDWAFMGEGKFKRDRSLYVKLCHSCHLRHDRGLLKKLYGTKT